MKDVYLLFLAKMFRMFSYGALSVIFIDVLVKKGLEKQKIGWLQSMIAFGDIAISLFLTTRADKLGRQKTLIFGAFLKVITGIFYAFSQNFFILAISGILGVISVSGSQIGPFVPIQQAAIAQIVENKNLPSKKLVQEEVARLYGIYNMCSYLSQAFGALFCGSFVHACSSYFGDTESDVKRYYQYIVIMYSLFGVFKVLCYTSLSRKVEPQYQKRELKKILNIAGLTKQSTKTIAMLSSLFIVDTFGGGFVVQSFLSYYFQKRYSFSFSSIGLVLFFCNIVGGISGVLSSKLVKKIGPVATMIYTHLPSNIFLIFIGLSSNGYLAIFFLLIRFCISQMDVPARQTYVSLVVSKEQRSAANGITNIARSVGLSLAFPLAGLFYGAEFDSFSFSLPFFLGGSLKIFYDVTLGVCFLKNKGKQEKETKKEFKKIEEMNEVQTAQKIEIENQKISENIETKNEILDKNQLQKEASDEQQIQEKQVKKEEKQQTNERAQQQKDEDFCIDEKEDFSIQDKEDNQ